MCISQLIQLMLESYFFYDLTRGAEKLVIPCNCGNTRLAPLDLRPTYANGFYSCVGRLCTERTRPC